MGLSPAWPKWHLCEPPGRSWEEADVCRAQALRSVQRFCQESRAKNPKCTWDRTCHPLAGVLRWLPSLTRGKVSQVTVCLCKSQSGDPLLRGSWWSPSTAFRAGDFFPDPSPKRQLWWNLPLMSVVGKWMPPTGVCQRCGTTQARGSVYPPRSCWVKRAPKTGQCENSRSSVTSSQVTWIEFQDATLFLHLRKSTISSHFFCFFFFLVPLSTWIAVPVYVIMWSWFEIIPNTAEGRKSKSLVIVKD
jgi:hypothetical protein